MGEHTKYQMEYIESVDGCAHQSAVDIIGALEQQRDELAEVVEAIEMAMRLPGVTAAEVLDWNSPIRAAIRAALAKYRQPQEEAPELFPGTLEIHDLFPERAKQ